MKPSRQCFVEGSNPVFLYHGSMGDDGFVLKLGKVGFVSHGVYYIEMLDLYEYVDEEHGIFSFKKASIGSSHKESV